MGQSIGSPLISRNLHLIIPNHHPIIMIQISDVVFGRGSLVLPSSLLAQLLERIVAETKAAIIILPAWIVTL